MIIITIIVIIDHIIALIVMCSITISMIRWHATKPASVCGHLVCLTFYMFTEFTICVPIVPTAFRDLVIRDVC